MMSNSDPSLTFDLFTARSKLRPYAFKRGDIEKSFSQNVLNTNYGINLKCTIKVANPF